MIKKSTIDKVFEAARVEEVIGDFVQLKKAGSNYKGLSPFTDERTPSFMVSPVKQIWKDFSSGKGGNVVSFLMEHEHYSYPEAIRYLAKKYGIEVEETEQTDEEKQAADERESMYLLNEFANRFFQEQLTNTAEGKAIGLSYFKERGFTEESIKRFDLGYSPEEWEALTNEALKSGYQLEFLEKTGLSIVKGEGAQQKKFDRFRGRVIFPIHSMSGRTLGFGGRILSNTQRAAKYLNSPESEIYHKSKILYGLFQAKNEIAKKDLCYLVEGYTDVIQFHQSGITNTVASSGTALTADQIRLINRLTPNIVVLFDGDEAGIRASLRGIDLILEEGLNVRICLFPNGEDPDTFAKKHTTEQITTYLEENAQDFINFKASLLMDEAAEDPIKKAEVIRDMMRSVAKIPDDIKQELYVKECVKIMDISEEVLYSTLAQIKSSTRNFQKREQRKKQKEIHVVRRAESEKIKVNTQYEIERHLIGLLLRYGDKTGRFDEYILTANEEGEITIQAEKKEKIVYEKIMLDLQEDEIEFTNTEFKSLYQQIIDEYQQNQKLNLEEFVTQIPPDLASEVTDILMKNERYNLHRWNTVGVFVKDKSELDEREVQQTILNLRTLLIKQKAAKLMESMGEDKAESHRELLEEIRDYKRLQVIIAEKLDSVVNMNI